MKKLLIIDDEENIRTLYQEYFSRRGFDVTTVENGEKAVELIAANNFDLVILDVELEGQEADGLTILKQIKAHNQNLPVILNSAYSTYKSDFSSWIADAYVVKSSDMGPLEEKIGELVG